MVDNLYIRLIDGETYLKADVKKGRYADVFTMPDVDRGVFKLEADK